MVIANRTLTVLGYIAYPLLLLLLVFHDQQLLLRCILVPACGFILCTALRALINAPRPYEATSAKPTLTKTTKGKSFPSRHTFSLATIALTWFLYQPIVGAILFLCAIGLGLLRVCGGVHYLRDIVAGIALALLVCAVGYLLVPWETIPFQL